MNKLKILFLSVRSIKLISVVGLFSLSLFAFGTENKMVTVTGQCTCDFGEFQKECDKNCLEDATLKAQTECGTQNVIAEPNSNHATCRPVNFWLSCKMTVAFSCVENSMSLFQSEPKTCEDIYPYPTCEYFVYCKHLHGSTEWCTE